MMGFVDDRWSRMTWEWERRVRQTDRQTDRRTVGGRKKKEGWRRRVKHVSKESKEGSVSSAVDVNVNKNYSENERASEHASNQASERPEPWW